MKLGIGIQNYGDVVQTRKLKDGRVWRRRVGKSSKQNPESVSTYEAITLEERLITKRNKQVVRFDPLRLFCSIYIAAMRDKNPDSGDACDIAKAITNQVLESVLDQGNITTTKLASITTKLCKAHNYHLAMRYGSRYLR